MKDYVLWNTNYWHNVHFRNLFLDGLFYAGSADSVEAAAELLSSKQIPEGSALRWYLDLNFVKHASRGSLKALLVRDWNYYGNFKLSVE